MRTNNEKVKNVILSVYFIIIILAVVVTALAGNFNDLSGNKSISLLIIPLIFATLFFLTHRISRFFEYDSDGVQVVITNRGLLLSERFNYREHIVEFEKHKLEGYRFNNFIFFKTLTIYLKGKHGNTKETFNVTLVSRRKRRYIRQSLSKIIKQNKKQKEQSINV